ncbi:MAG TPA: TonB-dependent receptor [Nevskiaceae bacterium]|nr:TonB-dependent receptor [Nevskiaceae bacterium]
MPPAVAPRWCVAGLALAMAGLPAVVSAAQPLELGAITTTATRVATPSYDVPASIDSVDGQQIREDSLGVNLSESVKGIPGLLARNRQNYAQDEQISIRGFGARTTFGVRGVRLYIDGIPASFPDGQGQVSNFDLSNASRIEVLRGPFSALYGNSSGGVIQIFTATGHRPDSLGGGVAYGSYDTLRANVDAQGQVGKLDYDADFTHFRTGGYTPHSGARRGIFQGKFTYHLDASTSLTAVLNNFSGPEAQDPQGLTRAQFEEDPRQASAAALQFNTRKSAEQHLAGLILKHDFGNGQSIRLMGYYGARQIRQFLSIPQVAQVAPTSGGGVVALNDDYGGGDARWTWRTDLLRQPLTFVAGLSYDNEGEHRRGYDNFIGSTLGVQGALRRNERDVEWDFAQYAQADWNLGQRWVLSAGVRHNRVNFDSHDYFLANGDGSGTRTYYATTPVAGVMYKLTHWAHLYADYGEGFQTPTFAELAYRADGSAGLNLGLRAARTENGELGVKFQLADNTNAEFTVFRAQTRHEIVVDTDSGGRSTYTNAGRVRRQGLEFSADRAFSRWWNLRVAYTYLDATVRTPYASCSAQPAPCSAPLQVAAGSRLPGVPESQVFAGLRWGRSTGLHVGVDGQYLSDVPVNDFNSEAAPAYGLIDTSVGYVWDRPHAVVSVFARVNNVLDTDYVGAVIVNSVVGGGPDRGLSNGYEAGPGRNFLLGINVRWKGRGDG